MFEGRKDAFYKFFLYLCTQMLFEFMECMNIGGRLKSTSSVLLMAIVNVTDDSFYAGSRLRTRDEIEARMQSAIAEGADILDIGGCSTRPGSAPVDAETEWSRVRVALETAREKFDGTALSLDTFRAEIARRAIDEYGAMIINDVSGLQDERMLNVVNRGGVPYVLTHNRSIESGRDIMEQLTDFFVRKTDMLQYAGVSDIIIDPGFGFGKSVEENWEILGRLRTLEILGKPILAGMSRKRMIREVLQRTEDGALNGTTAANMLALTEGATILRVHDVREAREVLTVYETAKKKKQL